MEIIKSFFRAVKRLITFISVMTLLFVLLTGLGVLTFNRDVKPVEKSIEHNSVPIKNYELNQEILEAMNISHKAAYNYASKELDKWIAEMLSRADADFMDDYFGFMQTKRREAISLYKSVVHYIDKSKETAEEAAIRELEDELSRKVIKPEISQARINNITKGAIDVYMCALDNELLKIQKSFNCPTPDWNEYISSICNLTLDIEQKKYPIAFKSVIMSSAGLTGYAIYPIVKKTATKVSTKLASKTATKAVATTGSAVTAKTTSKALKAIPYVGWGITAAIGIWDIMDYAKTSSEGQILLKNSLTEYFNEVKIELLSNSENGIMGCITQWENKIKENL